MADPEVVASLTPERRAIEIREHAEGDRWEAAAADPDFRQEMHDLAQDLAYAESPPE